MKKLLLFTVVFMGAAVPASQSKTQEIKQAAHSLKTYVGAKVDKAKEIVKNKANVLKTKLTIAKNNVSNAANKAANSI